MSFCQELSSLFYVYQILSNISFFLSRIEVKLLYTERLKKKSKIDSEKHLSEKCDSIQNRYRCANLIAKKREKSLFFTFLILSFNFFFTLAVVLSSDEILLEKKEVTLTFSRIIH